MKTQYLNRRIICLAVFVFVVFGVFSIEASIAKSEANKPPTEQSELNKPASPEQLTITGNLKNRFGINRHELEKQLLAGKDVNPKEVAEAFLKKEIDDFISAKKSGTVTMWTDQAASVIKAAEKMYKEIEEASLEGMKIDKKLVPLVKINILFNKLLAHKKGELRDNENKCNIIDTIASGEFQSRSGTDLFLFLAFEFLEPSYIKNMVYVNQIIIKSKSGRTIGHSKPGIMIDDRLYSLRLARDKIDLEYNGKIEYQLSPSVVLKAIEGKVDQLDGVYDPELGAIVYINGLQPNESAFLLPSGYKYSSSFFDLYKPGPTMGAIVPSLHLDKYSKLNEGYEQARRKLLGKVEKEQGPDKQIFSRKISGGMKIKYDNETIIPTYTWMKSPGKKIKKKVNRVLANLKSSEYDKFRDIDKAKERYDGMESPGEEVMKEFNRILANLKSSKYSLKGHVDEEKGIYNLDCCGLVHYVLKGAIPQHSHIIPNKVGPKGKLLNRPMDGDYFIFFKKTPTSKKGRNGWRRIELAKDVLPGDILSRIGHMLMIIGRPEQTNEGNFRVRVAECGGEGAKLFGDSRSKGNAGLGTGEAVLITDSKGQIIGVGRNWPRRKLRIAKGEGWVVGRPVPFE